MRVIPDKMEYRINKKGSECFRTDSWEIVKAKIDTLRSKKPNPAIYTVQHRSCRREKNGLAVLNWKQTDYEWSPWRDSEY